MKKIELYLWIFQLFKLGFQVKEYTFACPFQSSPTNQQNKQHQIREGCCEVNNLKTKKENIKIKRRLIRMYYSIASKQLRDKSRFRSPQGIWVRDYTTQKARGLHPTASLSRTHVNFYDKGKQCRFVFSCYIVCGLY